MTLVLRKESGLNPLLMLKFKKTYKDEDLYMELGKKIKYLRTKQGITQEALAEKMNVSRSAIAKWEANNGIPEIGNLKAMSQIFGVSIDVLLDENISLDKSDVTEEKVFSERERTASDCSEYKGHYYNIDLCGWNDGVYNALILGEDDKFLFYQLEKNKVYGLLGKKYITSVTKTTACNLLPNDTLINRNYFCGKCVTVELAHKEGFLKGFFDFRNDDYLDVVINDFQDSKIVLNLGREIDIDCITKIEEHN